MAANQGTIIAITLIVALLFVGIALEDKYDLFSISGSERMTRTAPNEVLAGDTFSVTYTASQVDGMWGASIIDRLDCGGSLVEEKRLVMISEEGTTKTVQFTMPNTEGIQCTLSGDYQFGTSPVLALSTKIIQIPTSVISQFEKRCSDGDIYWYDSVGVKEDLFDSCDYGCENAVCLENPCTVEGDENCDGIIDRTELGSAISKWISGEISRTNLGTIIQNWVLN